MIPFFLLCQAMEELVEKGLCKAIGISNYTIKKTDDLLKTAKIMPACNQGELIYRFKLFRLSFSAAASMRPTEALALVKF